MRVKFEARRRGEEEGEGGRHDVSLSILSLLPFFPRAGRGSSLSHCLAKNFKSINALFKQSTFGNIKKQWLARGCGAGCGARAKIVDGITCLSTRGTGLKCQSVVLREAKYLPRQLFQFDTRADGNGEEIFRFLRSNFIYRVATIFPNYYYIAKLRETHRDAQVSRGESIFLHPPVRGEREGGGSGKKKFRTLPTPCALPQLMRANVIN